MGIREECQKMLEMTVQHMELERKYWGDYAVLSESDAKEFHKPCLETKKPLPNILKMQSIERNNLANPNAFLQKSQAPSKISSSISSQTNYKPPFKIKEVFFKNFEERAEKLKELKKQSLTCHLCSLASIRDSNSSQILFGTGPMNAGLVIVGDPPTEEEEKQGVPFTGEAGELLTKMLASIQIPREKVYLCNVVKCMLPKDKTIDPSEIQACQTWLFPQLQAIGPKLICAMGTYASEGFFNTHLFMDQYRGRPCFFQRIPVICTYHPAHLLKKPEDKKKSWEDLKRIRQLLN